MTRNSLLTLAMAGLILGCAGLAAAQGPINPPGTPAPTMKTLDEISMQIAAQAGSARSSVNALPGTGTSIHEITQPGSYYLTGDVTGTSGHSGILVSASHVTIDLNGYSVVGVTGAVDGIRVNGDRLNIAVFNGTARNWPERGVNLETADNVLVRDLRAQNNSGIGIHAGGRASVTNCVSTGNQMGLVAGAHSRISHCVLTNSASNGLVASFAAGISFCTVSESGADGIRVDLGANISHCSVRQSTQVGIRLLNSLSPTREGAFHVSNCTVSYSGLGGGTNTGGILSQGTAFILNNSIVDNEQTSNTFGVRAENDGTRIDGNLFSECSKAIVLAAGGNLVARNTFRNCTTILDNTGTNAVGPLINDPTNADANNTLVNFQY